jgi:predicted nucleic acid-binding protein
MIVVDSNVIAYLYLPTAHTRAAEALLQRDPAWAAPVLWRSEFRNVLAGYLRRGTLSLDATIGLQTEAESLMAPHEQAVDSAHVLRLAMDSACTAYDCEFVSVAIRLGVPLVTLDKAVLRAFPQHASPLS